VTVCPPLLMARSSQNRKPASEATDRLLEVPGGLEAELKTPPLT